MRIEMDVGFWPKQNYGSIIPFKLILTVWSASGLRLFLFSSKIQKSCMKSTSRNMNCNENKESRQYTYLQKYREEYYYLSILNLDLNKQLSN